MTFGLQLLDASGAVMWDSDSAVGGVVIEVLEYAPGASGVRTYPDFSGVSVMVVAEFVDIYGPAVVVDYALGYPRVTVSAAGSSRTYYVVGY